VNSGGESCFFELARETSADAAEVSAILVLTKTYVTTRGEFRTHGSQFGNHANPLYRLYSRLNLEVISHAREMSIYILWRSIS